MKAIPDPTERFLTEFALAKALSLLAADPEYRQTFKGRAFDLLLYARCVHDVFRRREVLEGILAGTIRDMDDLSPFPVSDPD